MFKYEGHLIHESYDDEGIIEIVEQKGVRPYILGHDLSKVASF